MYSRVGVQAQVRTIVIWHYKKEKNWRVRVRIGLGPGLGLG